MTAVPEGALLLHIGPQKTGSTAIQRALHEARTELTRHGVHYGGPQYRMPLEAGWAVMGLPGSPERPSPRMSAWTAVLDDVRDHPAPRTLLSNENLALADDDSVARMAADLGADRLHVVMVARRLDRLLPSTWQERLKARVRLSYDAFLDEVTGPDGSWNTTLTWGPHDVGAIVERWSTHIPRDRITVIVADEADHDVVPRAFTDLLGLPDGTLVPPAEPANRSFTFAEAEGVRRVNQVAEDDHWSAETYWRVVKFGMVETVAASPRSGSRPIPGIPERLVAELRARADAQIAQITGSGIRVVGDPERLRLDDLRADDGERALDRLPLDLLATLVRGAVVGTEDMRHRAVKRERRRAARSRPKLDQVGGRELLAELSRRAAGRVRGGR